MTDPHREIHYFHIRADNDLNGNPRRLYLVITQGGSLYAIDEGYRGIGALEPYFPKGRFELVELSAINIPIREYRRLLNAYPAPELQV